ncbi:hypothetical protein Salat_0673800, partial [Sesamum alatum]
WLEILPAIWIQSCVRGGRSDEGAGRRGAKIFEVGRWGNGTLGWSPPWRSPPSGTFRGKEAREKRKVDSLSESSCTTWGLRTCMQETSLVELPSVSIVWSHENNQQHTSPLPSSPHPNN